MRSRLVLLVVAILLVAGFAALNWSEVMRPSTLFFGPVAADAPLGAILLGLLALAVIAFVVSAGAIRTNALLESRHHYKELEAQRALADKAEASRFTELRGYLDENLRPLRDRDAMLSTELQREMRAQNEATHRMLAARLNELEQRMDMRFERMGWGRGPAMAPPVTRSEAAHAVREREREHDHEHAAAEEARQMQMREEERMREERLREERIRDERIRDERERATASDRPGNEPSGWRRWF
ncbi:MAG TPA: hypothetical protein VFM98_22030 [Ramlibacter sp.]|uniref:hypothetical protein n=1 Tax=Ramlibacter sp. TaxID=1917967 RepID=UPI002D808F6E|nr:hypothetical protein [Ramlibacter sp.]HET8748290.1 hypothetical protein [Ramlibacter sp.]